MRYLNIAYAVEFCLKNLNADDDDHTTTISHYYSSEQKTSTV